MHCRRDYGKPNRSRFFWIALSRSPVISVMGVAAFG